MKLLILTNSLKRNSVENAVQQCGSFADQVRSCKIYIKSLILLLVLDVIAHKIILAWLLAWVQAGIIHLRH
jgi:hypothetical protein